MSFSREIISNAFGELINEIFDKRIIRIIELGADASERKIFRLFNEDNDSFIGVYNENIRENLAFINFTKAFQKLNLRVPSILNISTDNLFYIEDDLGDKSLFKLTLSWEKSELMNYYMRAISDLIRFQIEAKDEVDYNYCYQTKNFDDVVITYDLMNFNNYFLKNYLKKNINNNTTKEIINFFNDIISNVESNYFLYRDFQPRNIMIKGDEFYYIDYQSGRKGPLHYDIASFLYSGSININEDERNILLKYYIVEVKKYVTLNEEEFTNYFYFFAFLRLIQVLGSYSYLYGTRGDKEILKKIPKALSNLYNLKDRIKNDKIKDLITSIYEGK